MRPFVVFPLPIAAVTAQAPPPGMATYEVTFLKRGSGRSGLHSARSAVIGSTRAARRAGT